MIEGLSVAYDYKKIMKFFKKVTIYSFQITSQSLSQTFSIYTISFIAICFINP